MIGRLLARSNYRSSWLIIMGTFWLLFGVGSLVNQSAPRSWVLVDYAPTPLVALAWWATGAVALLVGIRGQRNDAPGHLALYIMPAVYVGSFLVSAFVYATTSLLRLVDPGVTVSGWAQSWYVAAVWALVSVMLGLGAAWPNPTPPLPAPPPTARTGRE